MSKVKAAIGQGAYLLEAKKTRISDGPDTLPAEKHIGGHYELEEL
ncbi:hypothetical protein [Caproicibacter sp. BJN0012]